MDATPADPGWIPEHAVGVTVRSRPPRPKRVGTTRVVLEGDLNPFERLGADERKRLLVRVLCGLVAYDTDDEPAADRLAG